MFDDEFIWGAGSSSLASEGAGLRSDWYRWEGTKGVSESADGNNFRSRYVEDFALFAEHGLRHLHLTLEWARIEPFPGRLDRDELEHVEQVLLAARDAGLAVWATLHDGSLPGWFSEDTDGFCTTNGPSIHWSRHVDSMAERFDSYVTTWWPFDDPIGWAIDAHHRGSRPPGRRSPEKFRDAVDGVLDATFDAHRLLSSGSKPVIGSFGLPTLHATQPEADDERRYWDEIIWRSWTRAITDGVLELPWRAAVERPDIADAFDAIGIGIASPIGVDPMGAMTAWPLHARRDETDRSPQPCDLGETLQRAAELLHGKDLLVTGLGAATDDDGWREELFEGWLDQVAAAGKEGLPIRGVFIEPVIDGYDVAAKSFVDSGVFNRSREPKPSFGWIAAQQKTPSVRNATSHYPAET